MSRCKPANTRKGQPLALDVPVQCTGSKEDDLDDGRWDGQMGCGVV
jgi:hypothetical protein